MKHEIRILIIWIAALVLMRLLLLFPHRDVNPIALINVSLQVLLFILCVDIALHSTTSQEYVYVNFALFFGFSVMLLASSFVGEALFHDEVYSRLYYHLYVNKVGLNLTLLFSFLYVIVDYFSNSSKTLRKYTISSAVAAFIVLILYYPFVLKPFQLYRERAYVNVQRMQQADAVFSEEL